MPSNKIDDVAEAVRQIAEVFSKWTEAFKALGDLLRPSRRAPRPTNAWERTASLKARLGRRRRTPAGTIILHCTPRSTS